MIKSILRGIASIFSFGFNQNHDAYIKNLNRALASDWNNVAKVMNNIILNEKKLTKIIDKNEK